jgi:uncharacterized protein YeaO (DUF488 family)
MTAKKPATAGATRFRVKRIYEPAAADDGFRVLVDRLWPRGIAKAKARIDAWLKDVAPSAALRQEFHDQPAKWRHFVTAYGRELEQEPAKSAAARLREHARNESVTLLYAARDESRNNAVALKEWLERAG